MSERAFQFGREMYIKQTIFCLPKEFQREGFIFLKNVEHISRTLMCWNLLQFNEDE